MRRGSTLFITGTDTGAGKTLLTAHLLAYLRATGQHTLATKPICTGPREDVHLLQSLQPGELDDDAMNPFWYKTPAAPIHAARRSKNQPTLAKLQAAIGPLRQKASPLLIEGAGGLLVPLAKGLTWEPLIQTLRCPVIITAPNRLGTLNHALLTLERLNTLGIQKKIICLTNHTSTLQTPENRSILAEFASKTPILQIPFLGGQATKRGQILASQNKIKKILVEILKIL